MNIKCAVDKPFCHFFLQRLSKLNGRCLGIFPKCNPVLRAIVLEQLPILKTN